MARHVRSNASFGPPVALVRTSGRRASGIPRAVLTGDGIVLAWTEAGKSPRVRTALLALPDGER